VLPDDDLERLRLRFTEVGYTVDRVMELIGAPAHAALGRNNSTPARRELVDDHGPLATFTKLWPLQATISVDDLDRALPGMRAQLLAAGMIKISYDEVRALIDLRPYGSDDGAAGWVFSDLTPGLDGPMTPVAGDFVLGVSPASMTLAELTIRRPVTSALDLGTGCGVQSLHLARHAQKVVATDVNQRALAMARATMRLNQVEVDLREGSLYEPVADQSFDLIVTNPPYVMSPPSTDGRLTYREAGLVGDELVRRVLVDGAARLNPGGSLQVLGNWAELTGQPWQQRLQDWVEPTGCDAHILRREQLDPYEYIEIWLADAGLVGSPEYRSRYEGWCDYFERLGIESVGMGWLTLTSAGRDEPAITIEDWPYAVEQPIGPAFADRRDAVDLTRRLTDAEILNRHWQLTGDVTQETVGMPGAADPEVIVLRQRRGFRRAVRAGTGLAGVLGACDGELRLDQIVGGVATIIGVDAGALAGEVLGDVRQLIVDGLLREGSAQDVE
jgi:SAM-dependent methyltransferase